VPKTRQKEKYFQTIEVTFHSFDVSKSGDIGYDKVTMS